MALSQMLADGHDVESGRVERLTHVRVEHDGHPKPCMPQDAGENGGLVGVVLDEQNGHGGTPHARHEPSGALGSSVSVYDLSMGSSALRRDGHRGKLTG